MSILEGSWCPGGSSSKGRSCAALSAGPGVQRLTARAMPKGTNDSVGISRTDHCKWHRMASHGIPTCVMGFDAPPVQPLAQDLPDGEPTLLGPRVSTSLEPLAAAPGLLRGIRWGGRWHGYDSGRWYHGATQPFQCHFHLGNWWWIWGVHHEQARAVMHCGPPRC